jgi:hypothetical protein
VPTSLERPASSDSTTLERETYLQKLPNGDGERAVMLVDEEREAEMRPGRQAWTSVMGGRRRMMGDLFLSTQITHTKVIFRSRGKFLFKIRKKNN